MMVTMWEPWEYYGKGDSISLKYHSSFGDGDEFCSETAGA